MNWTLKTLKISEIKNHPKNPRQITKEKLYHLKGLIAKFGLIDKPIVNLDMVLIGGHQRIKILKNMKVKYVECWIPDELLDEKDVEQLMVELNLDQGSFDYDILANNFEVMDLLGYGFSEEQLFGITNDIDQVEEQEIESKAKKKKCCPNCGHEF